MSGTVPRTLRALPGQRARPLSAEGPCRLQLVPRMSSLRLWVLLISTFVRSGRTLSKTLKLLSMFVETSLYVCWMFSFAARTQGR